MRRICITDIVDRMPSGCRCVEGQVYRHDPQPDDPDLETEIGNCPLCDGGGCDQADMNNPENF